AEVVAAADDFTALESCEVQRLVLMWAEGGRCEVLACLGAIKNAIQVFADSEQLPGSGWNVSHRSDGVKDFPHQPPSWLMFRPTGAIPSSSRCSYGLCLTVRRKRSRISSSVAPFRSGVLRSTSPSAIKHGLRKPSAVRRRRLQL